MRADPCRGWPLPGLDARGAAAGTERSSKGDVLGQVLALGPDVDHVHRIGQILKPDRPALDVLDAVQLAREMRQLPAYQDLRRAGEAGKTRSHIACPAPIAAVDADGLAGVEADTDGQGRGRIGDRLADECELQLDPRADRLPGRVEDRQRLVPSELGKRSAAVLYLGSRELGEPRRERRGGLVTAVLGKGRVAAYIRHEERLDPAGRSSTDPSCAASRYRIKSVMRHDGAARSGPLEFFICECDDPECRAVLLTTSRSPCRGPSARATVALPGTAAARRIQRTCCRSS